MDWTVNDVDNENDFERVTIREFIQIIPMLPQCGHIPIEHNPKPIEDWRTQGWARKPFVYHFPFMIENDKENE